VHAIQIIGKDVDLTKLPFHPQHAFDGSCYLSSAIDYMIDPATGRRNVGCRRLSLRNRYEAGTNVTAPSDLKRIYTACVERGQKLPRHSQLGGSPSISLRRRRDRVAMSLALLPDSAPNRRQSSRASRMTYSCRRTPS